jgi:hypothetical protein
VTDTSAAALCFAEVPTILFWVVSVPANSTANASAVVMTVQHALFRLLTAILALKPPYLALDLGVQRSTHEIGVSPTVAGNRLGGVGLIPVDDVFFRTTAVPRLLLRRNTSWLAALSNGGGSFVRLRDTTGCGGTPRRSNATISRHVHIRNHIGC